MHSVLTPMLLGNAWHAHSSGETQCQRSNVFAAAAVDAAAAAAAADDDDDGDDDDDD